MDSYLKSTHPAKVGNHWSGKTFKDAAKMDAELEFMYYRIYNFLSWHVHDGFVGHRNLDTNSFKAIYGNSLTYFLDTLSRSIGILLNQLSSSNMVTFESWLKKNPGILVQL